MDSLGNTSRTTADIYFEEKHRSLIRHEKI
jgi:hypothetical protein